MIAAGLMVVLVLEVVRVHVVMRVAMVVLLKEVVVERIVGMVVKGGGRVCCRESKCRNTSGKAGSSSGQTW